MDFLKIHLFDNFESTDTEQKAYDKLDIFIEKWGDKYPVVKNQLDPNNPNPNINYYFIYIKYNVSYINNKEILICRIVCINVIHICFFR